ncbi:MAG: hypothetical protein WCO94_14890 [Verrucomicrobiota bacterium]
MIALEKTTKKWWQEDGSQFDERDRDESLDVLILRDKTPHMLQDRHMGELDSGVEGSSLFLNAMKS